MDTKDLDSLGVRPNSAGIRVPGTQVAAQLGPATNPGITKPYDGNQIGRRYREAIEAGITEDNLVLDLKWMLDTAKEKENVNAALRVWRFIMEYTVGKPEKAGKADGDIQVTILQALQRGAEYMVDLAPDTPELTEDTEADTEAGE